jgi:hypothetical protein
MTPFDKSLPVCIIAANLLHHLQADRLRVKMTNEFTIYVLRFTNIILFAGLRNEAGF